MANKKKAADPSPIQQLIAYATPNKDDKCTLSLPISETENIDIEVKKLLDTDEMASFVSGVANAMFEKDVFVPAVYDLVLAKAIIAYYTDLQIAKISKNTEEPVSLIPHEHLTLLVFNTNIIQEIKAKISNKQIEHMLVAIDKSIEFKKQEILNTQNGRLEESIRQIELLTEAMFKIAEQYEGIDMKQVSDATIKLANMPEHERVSNILDVKFGESPTDDADEPDNGGDENV